MDDNVITIMFPLFFSSVSLSHYVHVALDACFLSEIPALQDLRQYLERKAAEETLSNYLHLHVIINGTISTTSRGIDFRSRERS